jgi:hypothetical protein
MDNGGDSLQFVKLLDFTHTRSAFESRGYYDRLLQMLQIVLTWAGPDRTPTRSSYSCVGRPRADQSGMLAERRC